MLRFIALIGASIGGALAWWLATPAGMFAAYMASVIGSVAGYFIARRWAATIID